MFGYFTFRTLLLLGLAIFLHHSSIDVLAYKNDGKNAHETKDANRPQRSLSSIGPPKISNRAIGEKELLVIRIDGRDGSSTTASRESLINDIFRNRINVSKQFAACSKNQFLLRPAEGSPNIQNGVVSVQVDRVQGMDAAVIYQEIELLSTSTNYFGRPLEEFDQVAICMPPGVTTPRMEDEQHQDSNNWIAFVPTELPYNTYMSIYNDEWCSSVSSFMHEVGHTLGLKHSEESDINGYDDETGHMGASSKSTKEYRKCFNPAKSWQLGWYAQDSLRLDPLLDKMPISVVLMGITSNIYKKDFNKYFLLQINNGDDGDFYIGYNHRDGFNADTKEGQDMLLINSQGVGNYGDSGNSRLLAKLDENETFRVENYRGIPGKNLIIAMQGRVSGGEGASVAIYFEPNNYFPSDGCAINGNMARFEVSVVTDEYPEDTSWTLTNDNTREIVASRSPGSFLEPMVSDVEWACLERDGASYTFEIFDSHQDGLCCDFGFGGYAGILDGKELFRGGEFQNMPSVTHSFVVRNAASTVEAPNRSMCEDDPFYLFNRKSRRDCKWVGRHESRRRQKCDRTDPKTARNVAYHCPSVCVESCRSAAARKKE